MKDKIIKIIKARPGKRNSITAENIAWQIGIEDFGGLTNPKTRSMIRKIIDDYELPIGSCPQGYYLMESRSELKENIRGVQGRINSMRQRQINMEECFNSYYGGTK